MGTWNWSLFSNDTTCDVRDTYIHFLKQQLKNEDAYLKTYEEYKELMGTEEESLFWYALADTQWNVGRLMPEVKEKSMSFIDENGGGFLYIENEQESLKWYKTLQKLKVKLEKPMPTEKKIKKAIDFVRNPWNVGDVYAYRFHTDKAKEQGLLNGYILFQKIGDIEYYDNNYFSAIQVFDCIYEEIPNINEIKELRILPLADPPGINGAPKDIKDYIPAFEWYLKATMICEKKSDFPHKFFTFIGNCNVNAIECDANQLADFYWEKDKMEEWLINYYLLWQNKKY